MSGTIEFEGLSDTILALVDDTTTTEQMEAATEAAAQNVIDSIGKTIWATTDLSDDSDAILSTCLVWTDPAKRICSTMTASDMAAATSTRRLTDDGDDSEPTVEYTFTTQSSAQNAATQMEAVEQSFLKKLQKFKR